MFRIRYIEPFIMLATLLRRFFLATLTGAIVGTGVSIFLKALFFSIDRTAAIPLWMQMIVLPIGGLLNGLIIYYGYRYLKDDSSDSVIAAVHVQSGKMPYKTLPIKPLAAIITLASGGSAGKEGPCSHIGGTLASWVGQLVRLSPEMQKRIVACGISAGFASVFGTPIAGAIYGVEVLTIGRLRYDMLFLSVIAGVTSFEISKLWGIAYTLYPFEHVFPFSEKLFLKIIIIGILCGLVSWLFIELFEQIRFGFAYIQRRYHIWLPFMPLFGGVVLALLLFFIPTDYLGLSLPLMERALNGESIPYFSFFWKALLVAITLGSGFYGGIVTPQFVIGAVSGNVFANMLGVDATLGAAVGMVAVVAAASNTPIAAIFMGFELFGSVTGIYIVAACITAYIIIGHRSVYPDQLVAYSKSVWMHLEPGLSLEKERTKIHISYGLLRKLIRWQHHQKMRDKHKE